MVLILGLGVLFGAMFLAPANGQAPPRVVLHTEGPAGQIRQLRFSSDSQRLYAAGMDKVVHVYEVGWNRGDGEPPAMTYAAPMYWERTRGNRGSIFSLGVHPSEGEMVIGGVGARQQTGDIGILDLTLGRVAGCLPTPEQRTAAAAAQRIGSQGHTFAIVSLDYSPSGDAIVSRDEHGGMFYWARNNQGGFTSTILRPPVAQASRFAPLALFTDDANIVYSRQELDGSVSLVQRGLRSGNEAKFTEDYHDRVASLARDPHGAYWASADAWGKVYLTDSKDPNNRLVIKASLLHVTALAFGGENTIAILSNEFIDGRAGETIVDLYDIETCKRRDRLSVSQTEMSRGLAISPDGRFLAVSKEDPRELLVFPLRDNEGEQLEKPLSSQSALLARPKVRRCEQLALSPDGKLVGFGPATDQLHSVLDLVHGEILSDQGFRDEWKFPVTDPPGWNVSFMNQPITEIRITEPTGKTWQIDLNQEFQGARFSHCFLFAPNHREPVGIAIGTEHIDSIFIYRFTGQERTSSGAFAPPMVRWFRDHTGAVTSLLPSDDGQTLFSGSQDNTIKLWRLSGLFDDPTPERFPQALHWGCDFVIENGNVVARRVDPDGIAFGRSLRDGDRITRIQGYDQRDNKTILDAQAGDQPAGVILQTLARVSVLRQNLIYAEGTTDDGQVKTKKFIIRPSWEPYLTAFSNQRDQWAIWHPSGFFNASAAEGGGLFEWMILRGADSPPRMVEGGFLSKDFERPETIQKLLSGLNLADSLAGGPVSEKYLATVIESTPEVTVVAPAIGETISTDRATVITARVDFGIGVADQYEVRGNIDSVRLSAPVVQPLGGNQFEYSWTVNPTGRLNQIEIVAKQRGGALASLYAADVAYRRGESDTPVPYRLHILSLASEDFKGPIASQRGGFGRLEYPIDDVEAIVGKLRQKQSVGLGKYQLAGVHELRDGQITPESVAEEIRTLNEQLRSQSDHQILIVYLSGHGTTIDDEYYYVTTSCESADESELRRRAIPWSVLDLAGAAGNRIIYMIDTCHSGSVVDAKSSIREPLLSGGIVIAAASGREAAMEIRALEHGCFTYSVLSALDGYADGANTEKEKPAGADSEALANVAANGVVDLDELVTFVRKSVRDLTGGVQKTAATPSRLTENLVIELVKTPDVAD